MKVHSSALSKHIDTKGPVHQLSRVRFKSQARQVVIVDGPFTESKESCSPAATLARWVREMDRRQG
jgi:hypothetical protein